MPDPYNSQARRLVSRGSKSVSWPMSCTASCSTIFLQAIPSSSGWCSDLPGAAAAALHSSPGTSSNRPF